MRNACKIFVRKPKGKRPRGKSRCRWKDNIRMDLTEIGWKILDWIHQAQDRIQWQAPVSMVMKLQGIA